MLLSVFRKKVKYCPAWKLALWKLKDVADCRDIGESLTEELGKEQSGIPLGFTQMQGNAAQKNSDAVSEGGSSQWNCQTVVMPVSSYFVVCVP